MEEKKDLESGFRILNILLLDSSFNRVQNVVFNNPEIKQEVNVDVNVSVNGNTVGVSEQLIYNQIFTDVEQVTANIKLVGVFEKTGDSPLDLEQFGQVNGAAIIYPFIREHLSSLSAKAGLGLIFLQPINLTTK